MAAETVGADCQAMCLVDGLVDDYEIWSGDSPEKSETVLYVHDLWILQGGRYPMSCPENTRPRPILMRTMKWLY